VSVAPLITVYPPLAPASGLRSPAAPAAFPFDQPGLRLTHLARGAVWLALGALGLGPGKRLAMPAYHCGSEVEAARLAGIEIAFYRVDASLRVDEQDLAEVAADADAVYLISHFGFPMPPAPAGLPLIEDVAHGLFSEGLGTRGDAAVFCPRKSLGVVDGGALLAKGPAAGGSQLAAARAPTGVAIRSFASLVLGRAALSRLAPLRAASAALLDRFSRTAAATRAGTLTETVLGEWDLEEDDMWAAAAAPGPLTARIARAARGDEVRSARRRNYELLLSELGELCPEPFRSLDPGVAPLYFPALVDDRDGSLTRLLEHGVRALEIWPLRHPLLDRERFPELEPLRRGLLALPVHQGLSNWHMDAVLRAARTLRPRGRHP
jgi:perosamine synthetase